MEKHQFLQSLPVPKTTKSNTEYAEDVAQLTKAIKSVKKTLCEMKTAFQAPTELESEDSRNFPSFFAKL